MDHYLLNRRVEIPTHTDAWMSGDMFGVVVHVTKNGRRALVKLDKSGRGRAFLVEHLERYGRTLD